MVLEYFLTEGGGVYMGVDFGGGDALMAEHGLDDTEVGTTFEQFGGEGVAQGVGRDGFLYARLKGLTLEHDENHGASEVGATTIEEDIVFFALFDGQEVAVVLP